MTIIESATSWAISIAKDQSHGYSQQNRWGPNYDCSSLVISAYKHAGVPIDTTVVNYTGNLQNLKKYGFQDVTGSVSLSSGKGLQRGDILWYHISGTNGHTAIYIGNGQIVHARGQSYGSSKTGDQGSEIAVTSYYRGSWQHVYRYVGGGSAAEEHPPGWIDPKEYYTVTARMPLIKEGCVGSSVRLWQELIGVPVDGEFGPITHGATIGFQNNHDLKVDGEVGPKTWCAALSELT